ncbi:hypothetical protein B0O99DRAFT_346039 [Bisporella sp. PMI_857]|nr:hypothetical protein B0O99DRAFT_346039 [Bisporella sp. PMI_857]
MVFAICNLLVLSSYAIPILAAPGTLPVLGNVLAPRVDYLGGWTIGRNGTGGGCPAEAPSACKKDDYSSLNTQCCPSDQTCFATSIIAYCCPTATDCKASVSNFPVCSVNGMIMVRDSTIKNEKARCLKNRIQTIRLLGRS